MQISIASRDTNLMEAECIKESLQPHTLEILPWHLVEGQLGKREVVYLLMFTTDPTATEHAKLIRVIGFVVIEAARAEWFLIMSASGYSEKNVDMC